MNRCMAMVGALVIVASAVAAFAAEPVRWTLDVDGLKRQALVYLPAQADEAPAPVVFGFHGHGGTAANSARTFAFQQHWPEAIVIYMQGVPTPGKLSDPEGKRNGWQHDGGDHDDRDLKFFDAMLAKLRAEHKIDDRRIYASGHSNGGAFTYLLWAQRPDVFAAFAPSGAGGRAVRTIQPKPAMHIAGEQDPLVKFTMQQRVMDHIRKTNNCEAPGIDWAPHSTLYASPTGTPFVTYIHPGGHKYPAQAPPLIVRFFKEHQLPDKPAR